MEGIVERSLKGQVSSSEDIENTVVDVGVAANGTYNWTLEFQCKRLDLQAAA